MSSPARPRRDTVLRAAVAALGGVLSALAFPRLGIWPLAIVGVAALSWAVEGRGCRTGAWLGGLNGLTFFAPLLHWTGVYVGPLPWLMLAGAEAVFFVGLGAVLPLVQRLPGAPLWIGCCWVLQEALRDRLPFGGFPWGRLAFSQQDSPLRWFVALGGVPLLSFTVALAGGSLAVAARRVVGSGPAAGASGRPYRSDRHRVQVAALALVPLVAVPVLGALLAPVLTHDQSPSAGPSLRVALVQGSVPDRGLAFEDRARQVLDNHLAATRRLAAAVHAGTTPKPDLVVWPENASDVDPLVDASAGEQISAVVRAVGAPLLVGAILNGPGSDHRRNAGILWSPTTGPGAMYVKRHPVPFAEYLPLRSVATTVSSAARLITQDMVAGTGNGLLTGGPVPLGDVICFEVAYDSLVRSSVLAGAQLLVVQTNNATFGHTSETFQQLAMSRLRAIETGRTVLQVSTTGISAVIDANGTVVAAANRLFTPAVLSAQVRTHTAMTPATRVGPMPEYLLALAGLLAAVLSAVMRWPRGGRPRPPADRGGRQRTITSREPLRPSPGSEVIVR